MEREQGHRPDGVEKRVDMEEQSGVTDTTAVSHPELADDEAKFERIMAIGRKVMIDHHAVLAALAK